MPDRAGDLDRFYDLLRELSARCGGTRTLAECSGRMGWPARGVYFFFEPGEFRADGLTPRVVRVGTHALRPSSSTLWGRLSQHRGTLGGSRAGGGNHRGSIFRLHVGMALQDRDGRWPEATATWGHGMSAPREVLAVEHALELAVSEHIGHMPFLWLGVDDEPSAVSDRGVIERGAIAALSHLGRPVLDPASAAWLGRFADRSDIRGSGLWNVQHVGEQHDPRFLDVMQRWLVRMGE